MSEFSEFLKKTMEEKGTNARQVSYTADRNGFSISYQTVYDYANDVTPPGDKMMEALAAGLGVSEALLREVAGLPAAELGPWDPPDEAKSLTRAQRNALSDLIRAIANGEGGSSAGTDEPPKKSGGPGGKPGPIDRPDLSVVDDDMPDEVAADDSTRDTKGRDV